MYCFEIVRDVLTEMYADLPGSSDDEKDVRIRAAMESMSAAYQDLKKVNSTNHADVLSRFAYIYKYVTSHANVVYQIINRCDELKELFKRDSLDIVCLGGGPGTELLGVLKYIEKSGDSPRLTCQLFDKERAWSECWSDVGKKVPGDVVFHTAFESIDIFNPTEWSHRKKFLNSDLFTMVFFMSEVFWNKDLAEPFFNYVFANAKTGALFLYVDNNDVENEFHGWFEELAAANGLTELMSEEKFENIKDVGEEKKDLGIFWEKFGAEYTPKLTANIAVRIYQKN